MPKHYFKCLPNANPCRQQLSGRVTSRLDAAVSCSAFPSMRVGRLSFPPCIPNIATAACTLRWCFVRDESALQVGVRFERTIPARTLEASRCARPRRIQSAGARGLAPWAHRQMGTLEQAAHCRVGTAASYACPAHDGFERALPSCPTCGITPSVEVSSTERWPCRACCARAGGCRRPRSGGRQVRGITERWRDAHRSTTDVFAATRPGQVG